MRDPYDILDLARFFLPMVPFVVVYLMGLVLALLRWRRHPTVSLLAVIAFGLFLTTALFVMPFYYLLPRWQLEGRWDSYDIAICFTILSILNAVIDGTGWILLLIALYGWRYPPLHVAIESDLQEPRVPDEIPDNAIQEGRSR